MIYNQLANKNEKNLISIIVPIFNVEKYIAQCLESLLKQTYRNIEILVVDDGSPDNSSLIADEYATKDSRVKVFHKDNGGLSSARNYGLSKAQGDYIGFVDSDDWVRENMYEILLNKALRYDLDIVKCAAKEVNDLGEGHVLLAGNTIKNKVLIPDRYLENHLHYYFEGILWKIACNGIYKRELALRVSFPEGLCYEDNYSAGMYLFYAKKIMLIDLPLYYYRINLNGISKSVNKRLLDIAFVTKKLIEDLKKQGLQDKKILKKLNNKLAKEIFHFIRDFDEKHRVVQINKDFYQWTYKNLDIRRAVHFRYLINKNKIKIN